MDEPPAAPSPDRRVALALLPLRLFLGVTFTYAGLDKLADPAYLDPDAAGSFAAQAAAVRDLTPFGALLAPVEAAPTATALLVALGEVAAGLGLLAGLFTRLAAAGAAVLALTFLLTVNWRTRPYYLGPDLIALFAVSPFAVLGAGPLLSLDAWRARAAGDPDAGRRGFLLRTARAAGGLAAVGVVGAASAGGVAAARRDGPGGATAAPGGASGGDGPAAVPGRAAPAGGPPVTPFTTADGRSAYAVDGPAGRVAFAAACTHSGCAVEPAPAAGEFRCPCHGGRFDLLTGAVLAGPPPAPLPPVDPPA